MLFQFTLPRRERHYDPASPNLVHRHFNSRSREGSDNPALDSSDYFYISIHAPAKGATNVPGFKATEVRKISIHAPAKGATAIFHKILNYYCETPPNNTQINPLNFNAKYINKIKISVLSCFFLVRITQ